MSSTTTINREMCGTCSAKTCSRSLIVFLSPLLLIFLINFGYFWRIHLSKTCDESTVWVRILCRVVQLKTFHHHQDYEQVNFYKNLRLYNIGSSLRGGKVTICLQLAQKWNFSNKIWQNFTFLLTLFDTLWCYAKRDSKSRVSSRYKLWIYRFVRNNGTKYLLIFDDSSEEICNSKAFVDIATVGRHRVLTSTYIKHNLFHQSKCGRDVELENTHIVLFKFPRVVMQVITLSAQLGIRSELVDWYRDATSFPYPQILIDLSPRTDDRFRYCTNTGSIPLKFSIAERLK